MDLFQAIFCRKSVRDYQQKPLPSEKLREVNDLIKNRESLNSDIEINVALVKDGHELRKQLSGIIANYGKVRAPHYLVLTSKGETQHLVEMGYSLEFLVLQLTTMGIGTCWIGTGFNDEKLRKYVEIPSGHSCQALIAFGFPSEKEQITPIEKPKRKGLNHFLLNIKSDQLDQKKSKEIECLRRAPSAVNSQPWRVEVDGNNFHLFIVTRSRLTEILASDFVDMNRIDAGIGLSHLVIGGRKLWGGIQIKNKREKDDHDLLYVRTVQPTT